MLLPSAYYEGTLLTQNITSPCLAQDSDQLCVQYGYPDLEERFPYTWGSSGYVVGADGAQEPVAVLDDEQVRP